MIIKDHFFLNNADNFLNLSRSQIDSMVLETNTPKHVYAALELKRTSINHFAKNTFLEYIKNVKTTKDLDVIVYDAYSLCATYNKKTKSKIINLSPMNAKEVGRVSHTKLYAAIVHAYILDAIVKNKLRIPDNMAQPISNYWFSLFNQVFGRDFGLTGTYSDKLPGLKFMLTSYILIAFFGRKQNKATFDLAKRYSSYSYESNNDVLAKHDLTEIRGLIRTLSESGVMPGFNIIKFTTRTHQMFGVQMLPMFEDLSRFMATIMASSVKQQDLYRSFIHKYNKAMYIRMLDYMTKQLKLK